MTGKIGTPSLQPKSNFRSFVLESRFYSNRGNGDQRGEESGPAKGTKASLHRLSTFELGMDKKAVVCGAPTHIEHVRLATDLTVFDVLLAGACGFVDRGFVPFATAGALEVRIF
jgi:hypothetical protein